jgi:hypothetical protein
MKGNRFRWLCIIPPDDLEKGIHCHCTESVKTHMNYGELWRLTDSVYILLNIPPDSPILSKAKHSSNHS